MPWKRCRSRSSWLRQCTVRDLVSSHARTIGAHDFRYHTRALAYVPSTPKTSIGGLVAAEEGFAAASAKERVAASWNRGAATRAERAATRPANMMVVLVEERGDCVWTGVKLCAGVDVA